MKKIFIGLLLVVFGFFLWPLAIKLWGIVLEEIIWPVGRIIGYEGSLVGDIAWLILCILLGAIPIFFMQASKALFNGILISVGVAFYPIAMSATGVISLSAIPHWWFQELIFLIITPPVIAQCYKMLANKSLIKHETPQSGAS